MPDLIDREARDFNRALLAEDRQRAFEVGRAGGGGRLDDAERSVAEFQRCNRGIFSFNPGKRRNRASMNADDIAKEPLQHIDMMAGLVGEYATVLSPGSAPVVLIVVRLIAAPTHPDRPQNQSAEPASVQRLARLDYGNVEAVLLDNEQLDACFIASPDHRVGVLKTHRHGLFDDAMFACLGAGDDMFRMHSARGQDRYRVDILAGKKVVDVIACRDAELRGNGVGARANWVANRYKARAVDMPAPQQLGMALGDASTTEQTEFDHETYPANPKRFTNDWLVTQSTPKSRQYPRLNTRKSVK